MQAPRIFAIYDSQRISDPLNLIACSELNQDGSVAVNYSSFEPLKQLIAALGQNLTNS